MAKRKPDDKRNTDDQASTSAIADGAGKPAERSDGMRETIESVIVAFILAFLFRTFEAEAFVIPTGSMAPTLYGRHKEINCDQCGHHFAIGASGEVDAETQLYKPPDRVLSAVCPNCRYRLPIEGKDGVKDLPVFKGDRILVNKFPYEVGNPDRWDVVVFKYPEDPKTNYIKRLVGLPEETVEIRQGDLYRVIDGKPEILRKDDPDKQKILQLLVYDNEHRAKALEEAGWPERWAAVTNDAPVDKDLPQTIAGWSPDSDGWQAGTDDDARLFLIPADKATDGRTRTLRYRHFVPQPDQWSAILAGDPLKTEPQPSLITDFCGYNAFLTIGALHSADSSGYTDDIYWVGDLTLNCKVEIEQTTDDAELVFELIEGFRTYQCRIDVNTGRAVLLHVADEVRPEDREPDDVVVLATADDCGLNGPGEYDVAFSNVDNRLNLWIDGDLVEFDEGDGTYAAFGSEQILQRPTRADLAPVGISAKGTSLRVSELRLERDIYYRAEVKPLGSFKDDGNDIREFPHNREFELHKLATDPDAWFAAYEQAVDQVNPDGGAFRLELGSDEFLMMGDNSPRSKDSRLWPNERGAKHRHAVPRSALVGKAFFVYWPHGVPFLNDGRGYVFTNHKTTPRSGLDADGRPLPPYPKSRFPFYPNFGRMHRIR